MSEDGERDPWRWINKTSSIPAERPFNGDLVGILLSDGQIISGRFEKGDAANPAGNHDWRIAGEWVRDDGVRLSRDDIPVMWCDEVREQA